MTTRERVRREFAVAKRSLAQFIATLRAGLTNQHEAAERQIAQRVEDLQTGTDNAIDQNEGLGNALQNLRAHLIGGVQMVDSALVDQNNQLNVLHGRPP